MDMFLNIKSPLQTLSTPKPKPPYKFNKTIIPKTKLSSHFNPPSNSSSKTPLSKHPINNYSIINKHKHQNPKTISLKNKPQPSFTTKAFTFTKINPNETNPNTNTSIDSNQENQIITNLNKGITLLPNGCFAINASFLLNEPHIEHPPNNNNNNTVKHKDKVILTSGNTKQTASTSITNVSSCDYYNTSFMSSHHVSSNISNYNNKVRIIGVPFVRDVSKGKEMNTLIKRKHCLYLESRNYLDNINKSTSICSKKSYDNQNENSYSTRSNNSYNQSNSNIINNKKHCSFTTSKSKINNEKKTQKEYKSKIINKQQRMFYINKVIKINQS